MAEQEPNADGDELLPPLKAAHHLGITSELLFCYTRTRFCKSEGQTRRLATVQRNGATLFRLQELDAFDDYLRQPWADLGAERLDVPRCIVDHLRAESGNGCIRCGSGVGVETAHIAAWAVSRSHHHHNVIRICSSCHSEHDVHNSLPLEELLALKQRGIAGTRAALERRLASISGPVRPPAPDPVFFGRSGLVQELREALQEGRAVQIRGPGGIGKTQLLLQALAGVDLGRNVVWLDVQRYRSASDLRAALEVAARHGADAAAGTLAQCLDAMHACLVLDGVEQLRGEYLDGLDDLLLELQGATVFAQCVVTTQVDLQRALFHEHFVLPGLEADAGGELLRCVLRDATRRDPEALSALLEVADGHPLTLRLIAMLANHYGSTRLALQQIERRGITALEVPKRLRQDRGTSLSICLSLAYDALDSDAALLAYLVASSPGGLHSATIESDRWLAARGRPAIAGLQRWSFIHTAYPGDRRERLTMLSPVARYVEERLQREHPERAHALTIQLVEGFAGMAGVIHARSSESDGIQYLLARYEEELPNLLRVLDVAEAHPGNDKWSSLVSVVCAGLMRFFFVLNLTELGARVMLRGARLSIRDGHLKPATDLLVQAVALGRRSRDGGALDAAERILSDLEGELQKADAETRGNVEHIRAMFACLRGRATEAERHARLAIELFESACGSEECDSEDIQNDLSASFGLLGDALLAGRQFELALSAYQTAVSRMRGGYVTVNVGQLLHQIGNCESGLGRHVSAAARYVKAADHFHQVGMVEFLGNALGELGHTLLDAADEGLAAKLPPVEVVRAALDDVSLAIARCFTNTPFGGEACRVIIRKVFGVLVVASLSGSAKQVDLGGFAGKLQSELVVDDDDDDVRSDALLHIAGLCDLAAGIAVFERDMGRDIPQSNDCIEELAKVCFLQGPSPDLQLNSFVWLALYLRRRWSVESTAGALRRAAEFAHAGHRFRIDTQVSSSATEPPTDE